MNINELKAFLSVANTLKYATSASMLHMTTSTLTRTIQRLESDFGQMLFERDNRSVTLTPAGVQFKEYATSVVQQWENLRQQFDPKNKLKGELRVFCSVTASYTYLRNIINPFQRRYPDVELHILTGDASDALEMVQKDRADLAFAIQDVNWAQNTVALPVGEIPVSLVAPIQFINKEDDNALVEGRYHELPVIMPSTGSTKDALMEWCKRDMNPPRIYAQVGGHEAIVSLISLGFGVSLVPNIVLENSPVSHQVQQLQIKDPIPPFQLAIIGQRKRLQNPVVSRFWDMAKEIFKH